MLQTDWLESFSHTAVVTFFSQQKQQQEEQKQWLHWIQESTLVMRSKSSCFPLLLLLLLIPTQVTTLGSIIVTESELVVTVTAFFQDFELRCFHLWPLMWKEKSDFQPNNGGSKCKNGRLTYESQGEKCGDEKEKHMHILLIWWLDRQTLPLRLLLADTHVFVQGKKRQQEFWLQLKDKLQLLKYDTNTTLHTTSSWNRKAWSGICFLSLSVYL